MVKTPRAGSLRSRNVSLARLNAQKNAETQAFLQGSKLRLTGYRKVNGAMSLWVRRPET
jgi:hypothetical protein